MVERESPGKPAWEIVRNYYTPVSKSLHIAPYFSNLVKQRINEQMATNILVCGEAGISKSYCGLSIARHIQPNFSLKQVLYSYSEVLEAQTHLPEGYFLLMDECEYLLSNRDWFKELNKVLVSTLRSGRFKVHPLILPTISKSLIDIVIRKYLVQFYIWVTRRGQAEIYRVKPSRFDDSAWDKPMCKLYFERLDVNKCNEVTNPVYHTWCLSCPKYDDKSCNLLRCQYERRRYEIQTLRYEGEIVAAKGVEMAKSGMSWSNLEEMSLKFRNRWIYADRGKTLDQVNLALILEQEYNLNLSANKVKILAQRLATKYPKGEVSE
jgi:hypothetical protein